MMPSATQASTNGQRAYLASGWFDQLAKGIAWVVGRPATFFLSIALIVAWALSGWFFNFSDTWQLVINTGTTIITFLMVFLIQNTQNRDTAAIHLKLDELIRSAKGARNSVINLEDKSEEELLKARQEFVKLAEEAHEELDERGIKLPEPECEVSASVKPR